MSETTLPRKIHVALPRGFDWPAALLLCAAMLTAATRLVVTKWTVDLSLVQTVTFLGVIAGLALGASRFSGRTVFYLATLYGAFVVPWQLGLVQQDEPLWSERISALGYRLGVIIYQLINKQTVMDSLLFLVLMCALFWVLGVYAGYAVVRHGDAWKVIVPTGLALFVIQYYDPAVSRRAWYLAFFIFFGLVLVARLAFIREHHRWQDNRTALPPHLSLDFIRFAVLFASLIVLLSWTAPTLAQALPAARELWEPVRSRWNESVNDMNYAFASLRSTRPAFSPMYSNNAVLGRGTPLGDTRMFTVDTPLNVPSGVRYYWRARSYDIYQNGQWFSSTEQTNTYESDSGDLQSVPEAGRWQGEFRFLSSVQMSTIFTPSEPEWISRDGSYSYLENGDGTLDISSFVATPAIGPQQIYTVRASLSAPTVQEMRTAGTEYPSWVAARYLQIPPEITPRTRQLAEEITAGLDNPYDKVMAVTEYLRENMTYVESITENPEPGQEPLDWFLFDLKQGFCNYYSSAEIILLRAVGVPARWSIGYAQGELLEEDEALAQSADVKLTYIVRNRDAHSWPEIYFPDIGWVEFEPTVSQPDLLRPADRQSGPLIDPIMTTGRDEEDKGLGPNGERRSPSAASTSAGQTLLTAAYWLAGVLGVLCLALALGWRLLPLFGYTPGPVLLERLLRRLGIQPPERVTRWSEKARQAPPPRKVIRLDPLPVLMERLFSRLGVRPPAFIVKWASFARLPRLTKAYHEINRALSRLDRQPERTATPLERASSLSILAPPTQEPAFALVDEYQIETFSPHSANLSKAEDAARAIRKLSYRAFLKRLLARFQRQEDERKRGMFWRR